MKTIFLSSNKINLVQLCPYKAHLEQDIGITPFERAEPLEKGDLLHRMLEHYYKAMMNPAWNRVVAIEETVEIARRANAMEMSLEHQTGEETIRIFHEYVQVYKYDRWIPLAVEAPFSKVLYEIPDVVCAFPKFSPMYLLGEGTVQHKDGWDETCPDCRLTEGLRIIFEGKIDLVVATTNDEVVVDHKGVSRDQKTLDLSNQFLAYCWAVKRNTLLVNKLGFQKTKKIDERFTRQMMSYTDERIEEWVTNTIYWTYQWMFYKQMDFYPRNLTSCDKWGGCTFREVCRADPGGPRDWKIKTLFKERSPYDIFQGAKTRGPVKFIVSGKERP